jgi:hypothetical protein
MGHEVYCAFCGSTFVQPAPGSYPDPEGWYDSDIVKNEGIECLRWLTHVNLISEKALSQGVSQYVYSGSYADEAVVDHAITASIESFFRNRH